MSKYDDSIDQESFSKRPVLIKRGQVRDRFVVINHDWFVPLQSLRRLSPNNPDKELESTFFPYDQSFDSHWQLFIEHQSHPPRIQIGLALLAPRDQSLRADIKLIIVTTHGEQIIKEHFFHDHTFFLAKGEPNSSYINEHISPKVCINIEDELYEDVINGTKLLNTDDCTILGYVRFINEFEIEPKTKAFDFSKRFTVDWKLTKFRNIIEQINQSRPPVGNHRRLVSDRFQFTHVKIIEGLKTKQWKLSIHYPRASSSTKQSLLNVTLKSSDILQPNYGKFEILCKNEHNILRRYIESMEDLTDNYTIEFFTLDELSTNIYHYKQNFNENNGRSVIVDYLLISVQIVQPFKQSDMRKKFRRIVEPTIISLNQVGNVRNKKKEKLAKPPPPEQPPTKPIIKVENKIKSPVSQGNTPNRVFPPIRIPNTSPNRLRSSSSLRTLPNIGDNFSRSFMYKTPRVNTKQSLTIPSASTSNSSEITDNFTFLTNLFRSGLHSDITIQYQDRQWNLHKSILSSRSIYFNQYFANSKEFELDLTNNHDNISSSIFDKTFLFLYTNQYTSEKLPQSTHLLFQVSIKYGIDSLTILCLQDMCNIQNLNINNAANLLIVVHQAITDPYEKHHSSDYLAQIKNFKQNILRFIHLHSRDVLLSPQWKILEKQYPFLVHDVLEFVVFEKIEE